MAIKSNLQNLSRGIDKFYRRSLFESLNPLSTTVTDITTQYADYLTTTLLDFTSVNFKSKSQDFLLCLGVIHWWFPEEISFLINLWLEENTKEQILVDMEIILSSKNNALGWLLVQDRWNGNDFFGILNSKAFLEIVKNIKLCLKSKDEKPANTVEKYTGYCRGYRDNSRWDYNNAKVERPNKKYLSPDQYLDLLDERQRQVELLQLKIDKVLQKT